MHFTPSSLLGDFTLIARSISFEFFTRFIQKTRSDSTVDASLIGMDLEAGFKGNVVGLDARDVPNDAM